MTTAADQPAMAPLLTRNFLLKALVIAMLAVSGLTVLSWPDVALWVVAITAAALLEDVDWRSKPGLGRLAPLISPVSRITISVLYSMAAWVLIIRGGPEARMMAFAVLTSSMVYVLMGYYRSPVVFLASIAPYFIVLGLVAVSMTGRAVGQGHPLLALTALFPVTVFGVLLWSARKQLSSSWLELIRARDEAEERERAAAAANRAKSQFLAMMSHEFRTPLNGVLGMTQAMAREKLSAGQAERLKVIRRSGENLLSILNDLLDLSKIEAKSLELDQVDFDLHHLLRGVAAGFGPLAARKSLTFDLQLCPDTAGRYVGDPARISRVLYCLVDNAVKFTREGQVALVAERVGPELLLSVSDTGIGIEPADKARLFESFFQAESSLSRRFDGAGLGLALSQELTRLMGGALGVTSVPGQGSTFTVRLPLARADGAATTPPGEPYIRHERPAELRVLAAEDNATNQLVLKTLL
ncbi:MAG: sensor histidine kinase/response regulator, partial [Caulobacteraceae bacterium]|nr:sensor histidine kinase/response regulator [Caulobacteraceae bacterium]